MRRIVSGVLHGLGYETEEAADGQQALDVLTVMDAAGRRPHLACIDWNMPVMDGLTLVGRIREQAAWRDVTMMMVTTESEHGRVVRALAAGAHEYLIKPFTSDAMRDKPGAARPAARAGRRGRVVTPPLATLEPGRRRLGRGRGGLGVAAAHVPRARARRTAHRTRRRRRRDRRRVRRVGAGHLRAGHRPPGHRGHARGVAGRDRPARRRGRRGRPARASRTCSAATSSRCCPATARSGCRRSCRRPTPTPRPTRPP
nr:response regulator [Angustibacter aerolatus]